MGALVPLALSIAPELSKWLFDDRAEMTTAAISRTVETLTGTSDVSAATGVLQRDPAIASELRLRLAQIAAEREQTSRNADLSLLTATLRDVSDTRTQANPKGGIAWSAPIISAVVLLTFGIVLGMVLLCGMPPRAETAANMLLGTLAAMATSVVSYWVGSSAGSARKDDRLLEAGK